MALYRRIPTSAPLHHKQYDDEQSVDHNSSDTSDDESQSLPSSFSMVSGLLQNHSHHITYVHNVEVSPSASSSFSKPMKCDQNQQKYTNTLSGSDRFLSRSTASSPQPTDTMHHCSPQLQRVQFESMDATYSNLLRVVPSEHEIDLLSLDTNQASIASMRKISGSQCARKYTSSSDLSTKQNNHSIILPATPRRKSDTETQSVTSCTVLQSQQKEKDKLSTWSYAYSYASNDISEQKKMNPHNVIQIQYPRLVHEIQPKSQQIQISEANPDTKRLLYTGCVTTSHIAMEKHELLHKHRLSAPMLIYQSIEDYPLFILPVKSVQINIDIAAETAFIDMKIVFVNNADKQISIALFALPTINGIVSDISVCIEHDDPLLQNTRLASDLIDKNTYNRDNDSERHYDDIFEEWLDVYICDLFRFPIANIRSYDSIKISCKWQQTLEWNQGRYHLNIPLQFTDKILPENAGSLYDIIQINVTLNSLFGSLISFGSNSHNLIIRDTLQNGAQIQLYAEPFGALSSDLHIAYRYASCKDINSTIVIQKESDYGKNGHFILCINPMNEMTHNKYTVTDCFARDIMFMVDRSISMDAATYNKVTEAIANALDNLLPTDTFGIICFNETQIYFDGSPNAAINTIQNPLFEARAEYIAAAKLFLTNCVPEGGTDIATPLKWTLNVLNDIYEEKRARALSATVKSMPFVVLITDGSDYEEKQIIAQMNLESACKNVRILTFGVGKHCNQYFLELLALKSRGWHSSAVYDEDLGSRMKSFLSKCEYPILKDVLIEPNDILDHKDITLYPPDATDIYLCGKPIFMCGEYRNNALPEILSQTGLIVNVSAVSVNSVPQMYEMKVQHIDDDYFSINLQKMCAKQKLDQLTSLFWFNDMDEIIRNKIVNISTTQKVGSEYISMACFEGGDKNNCIVIGLTNQLFGNPDIDHYLSKVVYSHSAADSVKDTHHEPNPSYCCGCCCIL